MGTNVTNSKEKIKLAVMIGRKESVAIKSVNNQREASN